MEAQQAGGLGPPRPPVGPGQSPGRGTRGGAKPHSETGFQANRRPIRMLFLGCFGCSKAAYICEFTEYFIENFI